MIHDILATIVLTRPKVITTMRLVFLVLPYMPDDTEKSSFEMGKTTWRYSPLVNLEAKTAVVTLIGEAHLEFFGSRDKIAQGKMQMQDGMPDGSLLLCT